MKIAIIGAGMAGLTAARSLQAAGAEVTVFDKSKGTGGRISSRSFESGWIDHGAPYFSVDSREFHEFLSQHLSGEILQRWQPEVAGDLRADEQVRFIGVPRNSAITRALLGGLSFQPSTRIARLQSCPEGWQLYNDGESLLGVWPQVVIAVPAPQALALLGEQQSLAEQIRTVRMEPCWVAAIRTHKKLESLAEVTACEHPVIRRIIHNSAKPGRQNDNVYLLQATRSWSEAHLEEPENRVREELLANFCSLDAAAADSDVLFVHRWRYAFTETALGLPCLWDRHLNLGVCGDWCLGRKVEDAWQSGIQLARQILMSSKDS